jgi:hypothetical protein
MRFPMYMCVRGCIDIIFSNPLGQLKKGSPIFRWVFSFQDTSVYNWDQSLCPEVS